MRSEFVYSLCIAEQLGVLKSIEHLAKRLQARGAPLSPSTLHDKNHQLEETASTEVSKNTESAEISPDSPTKESDGRDNTGEAELKNDLHTMEKRGREGEEKLTENLEKLNLSPGEPEHSEHRTEAAVATCANSVSKNTQLRFYGVGAGTFLKQL